MIEGEDKLEVR